MTVSIFYHISQSSDQWNRDHYQRQIQLLESSGLYSRVQEMHIHVTECREHLGTVPDRTRQIHYHRDTTTGVHEIMRSLRDFADHHPYHKILYLHSDQISQQQNNFTVNRRAWTEFLEFCNVTLWHKCIDLLDFYDTVGADYINYAIFDGDIKIWAPHYPGMFWWTTAGYIRKLDLRYLDQDVAWAGYLPELWIGSAHPRGFLMMQTDQNPFYDRVTFDRKAIEDGITKHLESLKVRSQRY